jgi:hypothetical protein
MLKYSNSRNQIIAKEIADLTINNYQKGLTQKLHEESQNDDADVTNTIVPTSNGINNVPPSNLSGGVKSTMVRGALHCSLSISMVAL